MKKIILIVSTAFVILFGIGAYTTFVLFDKIKPGISKTWDYLNDIKLDQLFVDLSSTFKTQECQESIGRNLTFDRLFNISLGEAYQDLSSSCIKTPVLENCIEGDCKKRRII